MLRVQISSGTSLAHRYNDIAPLESHHCSFAFQLLEDPRTNAFHNLTPEQFRRLREDVIRCILATDMGRHNDIIRSFKSTVDIFDINEPEHKVRYRGGSKGGRDPPFKSLAPCAPQMKFTTLIL